MNIIDKKLKFNKLGTRKKTEEIILHHSGVTALQSVELIHNYHKNTRGWAGIGYHFYVRKDGEIYSGRPEVNIGAHCTNHNYNSIGICFEGNYEVENMNQNQIKAGKELIAYILEKYKIKVIKTHRDYSTSICPGEKFPYNELANIKKNIKINNKVLKWQQVINKVYGEKLIEDGIYGSDSKFKATKYCLYQKSPMIINDYVLYVQTILKEYGYNLKLDKIFGPDTREKVIAFQKSKFIAADGYVGKNTIEKMLK